jgi:prepilin-type N-terminal cleavage/methylation domain-containing protein
MSYRLSVAAARGLTLIEVLIIIAILAIVAAIVYPNIVRKDTPPTLSEGQLIEQAKTLAQTRAQPVRLSIQSDGTWEILSEDASGLASLAAGHLAEAPAYAVELRVTELGTCFAVRDDRLIEEPAIDTVSCTRPLP